MTIIVITSSPPVSPRPPGSHLLGAHTLESLLCQQRVDHRPDLLQMVMRADSKIVQWTSHALA